MVLKHKQNIAANSFRERDFRYEVSGTSSDYEIRYAAGLPRCPVQKKARIVEAQMVPSPAPTFIDDVPVDGIVKWN